METIFAFSNVLRSCVFAVAVSCMYLVCSLKMMGALQQSGYANKKFFAWYRRKDNLLFDRLSLTFLLIGFASAFCGVCFSFLPTDIVNIISILPFFFFLVLYIVADGKYALKVPYKKTKRFYRLAIAYFLLLAIFNYICLTLVNIAVYFIDYPLVSAVKYVPMSLYVLLLPATLALANAIMGIYERSHSQKFIRQAKEKLDSSSCIKIGVTGSYGKTSVKHILASILAEKYKVFATPASFNTPIGVAKCVNEKGLDGVEVFIAEMGARHRGDISELCDLVSPDYTILTGICSQHLESFGSVENIIKEKTHILQRAKIACALPILSDIGGKPDLGSFATVVGKDVELADVKADKNGTTFTLTTEKTTYDLKTKLLGEHSADNIALAVVIAEKLGLSKEEITRGVAKIDYVEHRLQVITANGVTILDDSYNANVKGAQAALKALTLFDGEKYVVTPGLVELGILEKKENENFGKSLVGVDHVILVGETLVGCVKNGYLAAGGDPEKCKVVPTLQKAKELLKEELKEGDAVLFLNDLPDVY